MSNNYRFTTDPTHKGVDLFEQELTQDIWRDKYRWDRNPSSENHPYDSFERVAMGVYEHDTREHMELALEAMKEGLWVPAGRIQAGAGTNKIVTMINCYVCRTIPDSMDGIGDALKDAMLTMQQGGGIGMDFSTLRPTGAWLSRTGAVASGPLPFMDMWNSMCSTIMSAGSRRGAMMGVMHCEHPDLPAFIEAKKEGGRLTNFNVSILVTDGFMEAVALDENWYLGFDVPRADGNHIMEIEREDGMWYIYSQYKARDLWNQIIESTYEYSEPGVIFIDRINDQNNLKYVEDISCTNPCGEQPLPPNGACNLGAVNLARLVKDPFGEKPTFDFDTLEQVVHIGVRFLDNVIDVTHYPLEAQQQEEDSKRRIGLGITGLADTLAMMKIRYGSERALQVTNSIMEVIKVEAYRASCELAAERGPFPVFKAADWGKDSPVVQSLPHDLQQNIQSQGIRNGVLLTIAPTGTTSIYCGNVSSGLEPVFLHEVKRKVLQPDGTRKEYTAKGYSALIWDHLHPGQPLPPYMVTAFDLQVRDHIRMQSVCQKHIDASVSKTINCPEDMSIEEFKLVYWDAYELGCKGCTTYRPSDMRGSVLSGVTDETALAGTLPQRPDVLHGRTYKIKWPNADAAYYITINDAASGAPFEIFISSTSAKYADWSTALSLMISAIMRKGDDISFIPEELGKVISVTDYAWINGKFYGSLVALIGDIIKRHIDGVDISEVNELPLEAKKLTTGNHGAGALPLGEICPACHKPTMYPMEGCTRCLDCGYSTCG